MNEREAKISVSRYSLCAHGAAIRKSQVIAYIE